MALYRLHHLHHLLLDVGWGGGARPGLAYGCACVRRVQGTEAAA